MPKAPKRKHNSKRRRPAVRGITRVSVTGYKSIYKKQEIEIRRLTILAGANSSGKSSIMQPLLLLKQTLEAPFDPGPLEISGPNVQFTSVEQILSRMRPPKSGATFGFGVEVDRSTRVDLTFQDAPKAIVSLVDQVTTFESGKVNFREGMRSDAVARRLPKETLEILTNLAKKQKSKLKISVERTRCFLGVSAELVDKDTKTPVGFSMLPTGNLDKHLKDIIHVPGLRGNPERTYRTSAVGSNFPGLFQDYIASIVHSWRLRGDARLEKLGEALHSLGLSWKVDTRLIDDTRVEITVGRMPRRVRGAADMVSLADVGFGVSQALPVLIALQVCQPGQLVYVEQPELHLHPRSQVAIASLLVDAARRGVRLVVETHSGLLLLAIQALIAEGKIDSQRVIMHWFSRSPKDGSTAINSVQPDSAGTFGDWPVDFGDVDLEIQSRFLDASEKRLTSKL